MRFCLSARRDVYKRQEQKWFVRVFDRDDERGPNEFMNRSNQNPVAELAVYALEEDVYKRQAECSAAGLLMF